MTKVNPKIAAYKRGHFAELFTCIWLMMRGYRILTRRLKTKIGEVDIVAKRAGMLIFVEVKARPKSQSHDEVLTVKQQKRITQAASLYLAKHPEFATLQIRFDVMIYRSLCSFRYIKQAWLG